MYCNLIFVLLVLISCVTGETNEQRNCLADPLEECRLDLNEDAIPWNVSQRRKFCKNFMHYFECAKEKYPVDQLCVWPLILHNSKDLVVEFCNDRSPLSTNYLRAAKCYRDHFKRNVEDCSKLSHTLFRMYMKYSKRGKCFAQDTDLVDCVKATHRMECIATKLGIKCGSDAYNTFKVILKTSNYYLLDCTNGTYLDIAQSIAAEIHEGLLDNRYPRTDIFI